MEKPFDQELLDLVVWPTWPRPHRKKCGWSHQALKHKLFSAISTLTVRPISMKFDGVTDYGTGSWWTGPSAI